ncbi:MAG TPA: helix-turn-helix domain-containing protein [Acidimicrobiia bacterium]
MAHRQPYKTADERKADILDATVELLAEYGPDAITVRQIAERAGVQHTVIFRHFGDKAALIRQATLGELVGWAEVAAAQLSPVDAFIAGFRYLCKRQKSATALSFTMSGVSGPAVQQDTFPVVDAYAAILVAAGMQVRAARDLTMAVVAIITGWVVAEDWWLAVSKYRGATARIRARRAVEAQIRLLVEAGLGRSRGTRPDRADRASEVPTRRAGRR